MSRPANRRVLSRSEKRDFFESTAPLSLEALSATMDEELAETETTIEEVPQISRNKQRSPAYLVDQDAARSEDVICPDLSFQFEMEVGTTGPINPILRDNLAEEKPGPSRKTKRLSWGDEMGKELESFQKEEHEIVILGQKSKRKYERKNVKPEKLGPPQKRKYERKKVKSEVDEEEEELTLVMEPEHDPDEMEDVMIEKKPKRKYERKNKNNNNNSEAAPPKKKNERKMKVVVEEDSDEEPVLVMDASDEEDEGDLMIADGEEPTTQKTKGKRRERKRADEIKREKMAETRRYEEIMEELANFEVKTDEDLDREYELLMEACGRKVEKEPLKSAKVELDMDRIINKCDVQKMEMMAIQSWEKNWITEKKDKREEKDDDIQIIGGTGQTADSQPEVVDLEFSDSEFDAALSDLRKSEEGEKRRLEEEKEEEKEGEKKRRGGKGERKEKVVENEEKDEATVVEEIEKKMEKAREKAEEMKRKKEEQRMKREEQKARKKEKAEAAREEKRLEREEMNLLAKKPKNRAEAARITKALLKLGAGANDEEEIVAEEEEEKIEKRRRGRKEAKEVVVEEEEEEKTPSLRRGRSRDIGGNEETPIGGRRGRPKGSVNRGSRKRRMEEEDEDWYSEEERECGNYARNPCDIKIKKVSHPHPEESSSEDERDDDPVLSRPFLWTGGEEREEGAIGPANFDPDEEVKRRLNGLVEFSSGLSKEYHEMTARLDGMRENIFADSMRRRCAPRSIHNIDSSSTLSFWPADLLPLEGKAIPKYSCHIWRRKFAGLVRIRPESLQRDRMVSREIDRGTEKEREITKKDLVDNLHDLIMSKMNKTAWKPLPPARNPFDVPEVQTRSVLKQAGAMRSVSYVQKYEIRSIEEEGERGKKKRRKTRKEMMMMEIVKRGEKRGRGGEGEEEERGEDLYKPPPLSSQQEEEEGDGDGYMYEWNEMGEMIGNPMMDGREGADPFGGEGMLYEMGVEEGEMREERGEGGEGEGGEESQLGGAFSFMANQMDA